MLTLIQWILTPPILQNNNQRYYILWISVVIMATLLVFKVLFLTSGY